MKRILFLFVIAALVLARPVPAANTVTISDTTQYSGPGVTITLSDSVTMSTTTTNASWQSFVVDIADTTVSASPLISNGVFRVKNNSTTNFNSAVYWGNNGTNYPNMAKAGEFGGSRLVLDGSGVAHMKADSNSTPVSIMWIAP